MKCKCGHPRFDHVDSDQSVCLFNLDHDTKPMCPCNKFVTDDHMEPGSIQYVPAGPTRRDWFAGMALQGMCSVPGIINQPVSKFAKDVVEYADAMIKELDK